MRKITYWVADRLDDSSAYSLRVKTRREVLKEEGLQFKGGKWTDSGPYHCISYSAPRKVTVEYTDLVDLLRQALGEGGIE